MVAILLHFLGNLLIDSAVPPWAGSADAYFLAMWFAGFAAVDLVAAAIATGYVRAILVISFAWSSALAVEQLMLEDLLHQADQFMQIAIDGPLFVALVVMILSIRRNREAKV